MRSAKVKFTCPTCGENQLAQLREKVTVVERVDGIFVMDKNSPGRKFNADLGARTETDGKVTGYVCEVCGFKLVRSVTPRTYWPQQKAKTKTVGVKSPRDLHLWLKEHEMLHDPDAQLGK